ncbi:MAG: carboxypeptidase-like regulatory domain-containing protein [Planctomycetaceae bacterium]
MRTHLAGSRVGHHIVEWSRHGLMLVCLVWIVVGQSCADEKSVDASTGDTVAVRGVVVDDQGQPVAGARVEVRRSDSVDEAVTTQNGRFEFSAVWSKLRGAMVLASADNGAQLAVKSLSYSEQPGELGEITLSLEASRRIELRVLDPEGQPVPEAVCGVQASYRPFPPVMTDSTGVAQLFVPADQTVQFVYAIQRGVGLDYRAFGLPREQRSDQNAKPVTPPDGPITLTMGPRQPLRVEATEPDGTPIEGLDVYPWLLRKPGEVEELNLSFLMQHCMSATDADGQVEIDFLPQWQQQPVTLWANAKGFSHLRASYDPQTGDGFVPVVLDRLVPLRGRVTMPSGESAVGVRITVCGAGNTMDPFRGQVRTDAEGRYEIPATPNMVYLVLASQDKLVADELTNFAIWPGQPAEGRDLVLRPGTRIFGRMTTGSKQTPVVDTMVQIYQYGRGAYNNPEIKLPNSDNYRYSVTPMHVHTTKTDREGRYEFWLGDGEYDIRGTNQHEIRKFKIDGDEEREFDFHAQRAEKGRLSGSVVSGNPSQPVADAKVWGVCQYELFGEDINAQTDQAGEFEVVRDLHPAVLFASSVDESLGGILSIGPDDEAVTIELTPMSTASGQFVNAGTGMPIMNAEIVYGVQVRLQEPDGPFRTCFGGTVMTDDEGRFQLRRLVVGQRYEIRQTHRGSGQHDLRWTTIGAVTPQRHDAINLGVIANGNADRSISLEQMWAKANSTAMTTVDPLKRFIAVRHEAERKKQCLLVILGDPASAAYNEFLRVRIPANQREPLEKKYAPVFIPWSPAPQVSSIKLARLLDGSLPAAIDETGLALVVVETAPSNNRTSDGEALSTADRIDQRKVLQFLLP